MTKLSNELIESQLDQMRESRGLAQIIAGVNDSSIDFTRAIAGNDKALEFLIVPLLAFALFHSSLKELSAGMKDGGKLADALRQEKVGPITESLIDVMYFGYRLGRAHSEQEKLESMA